MRNYIKGLMSKDRSHEGLSPLRKINKKLEESTCIMLDTLKINLDLTEKLLNDPTTNPNLLGILKKYHPGNKKFYFMSLRDHRRAKY